MGDEEYREYHEDFSLQGPDPPGEDDSPPDGFVWCKACGIGVAKDKQWVGAGGPYCLPCAMDIKIADHLGVEPWGPEFQVLTEERRRR